MSEKNSRSDKSKKKGKSAKSRLISRIIGFSLVLMLVLWAWAGVWFVHHPRKWISNKCRQYPAIVTAPLLWMGNPIGDITDALGLTGHDAVYEYDEAPPYGSLLFAGAPRRVQAPAPEDIQILQRGEFVVGWSDSLRHPVWCAYRVPAKAKHENSKRPGFIKDRLVPAAPSPSEYTGSGYDRGHMVPNYAIVTRFGTEAQRRTFQMSNISPQSPALNRGVWRNFEHRIADLWAERYGEVWVVVGSISNRKNRQCLNSGNIDIPDFYYQIVVAQEDMFIRALAVIFPQDIPWRAWAARNIITIDELEELTGLDFLAELPLFIQDPLEAELPSRLWPIRAGDIFKLISLRFD